MKQLVEDIAKALVDIPEAVSVRVVEDEHWQARPYRQRHPDDSQRRRDETESPIYAGDPR